MQPADLQTTQRDPSTMLGRWLPAERTLQIELPGPFAHEIGHCYTSRLSELEHADMLLRLTDNNESPFRSPLKLLEDGRPLGAPHAAHSRIRETGGGAYSFWDRELYLSASDSSDPNSNGRRYTIALEDL
jgi:hypothetical protein